MLFDNTEFNYEISLFQIPGNDFNLDNRIDKFYTPEEGFLRGNMMKEEYAPYKKWTFMKLKPETERESLLFQLMSYSFAINDLNLYLDMYPEDKEAFHLFQKYVCDKNEIESMYISQYGPMTVTESKKEPFDWIKNPWPWDSSGGTKYV